jgi:hypothetical protein
MEPKTHFAAGEIAKPLIGTRHRLSTFSYRELNTRGTNMTDPRHYSRWSDPWRREDDWGPITAGVMILIILAGLIVYGSAVHP